MPGFQEDLAQTVLQMRGALTDVLASVGVDPGKPQAMSRQLGLDKTLAWKIGRLVTVADPAASLEHLPGASGMRILLAAVTAAGATDAAAATVTRAREAFDRLIEVHSGDRATLEAMVSGLRSTHHQPKRAESARRQSFLGNSATWGIQARVRVGLHLVAPAVSDASRIDLISIGALHELRRLRADTRWPLVIHKRFDLPAADGSAQDDAMERIGDEGMPLLREFCSSPLPDLRSVHVPNGTAWELSPGPVGKTANMTATFGFLNRSVAPVVSEAPGQFGEHLTMLNTPAETLLVDLLVHRTLPFASEPEALLVSRMESDAHFATADCNRHRLPLHEKLNPIGSMVSTPLLPRHPELVAMAAERIGHPLSDFAGYRLVMRYPPIPAVAVLRNALPTAEGLD